MKTIQIGEKTYELPTSWEDMDMKEYIKTVRTLDKWGSKALNSDMIINIISNITGISIDDLKNVPLEELKPVIQEVQFILNAEPETLDLDEKDPKIDIGGHTFKINSFGKTTVGEALFIEQQLETSESYIDVLDTILASLVRPVTSSGEIEDFDMDKIEERKKFFYDNMTVSDIYTISIFFSKQEKSFIRDVVSGDENRKTAQRENQPSGDQ